MSPAFADPAKYDFYDCKQLEAERKALATRGAELQGLMAKADTGVAGPVVAELAYRNDYIAVRAQGQICRRRTGAAINARDSPPATGFAGTVGAAAKNQSKREHVCRSGNAVY